MTEKIPFKFDEIGAWSEIKLEIVEKYGAAYTTAFINAPNLKKYYIDAFCGPGVHVSKADKTQIEGSPARALKVQPSFDGFHFIDLNSDKIEFLRKAVGPRPDVQWHPGDSNKYLIETLLPTIKYEKFNRALCLLDPYGMHLDWQVMQMAGKSRAIDMFLNFPVADMNRNALWKNTDRIPQDGIDRMTAFWGDDSWRKVAYVESKQQNLFGAPDLVKQDNETIADAFKERLRKVAGFAYVADPLPMKNDQGAVVYYLFFASSNAVANKIIKSIYDRYR